MTSPAANREAHLQLVDQLRAKLAEAALGGSERARERHVERGKLLPRERVDGLLDPGTPVPRARAAGRRRHVRRRAARRPGSSPASAGSRGASCVIVANDATGQGRHLLPDDGQEAPARPGDRPARTACPASTWSTPAAPSCPCQDEVFPDRDHFGRIFYNQARMSARRASRRSPPCWARAPPAAPTCPAMSDETVIVRNQGTIFLGGPPLVKAATGEVVTAEELGGGELHTTISGVADHLARRRPRTRWRSCATSSPPSAHASRAPWAVASRAEPDRRPARALRRGPGRPAEALRRARGHRPHRRRQPSSHEFKAELRHHPGHRLRPHPGPPGRHRRQQRRAVLRVRARRARTSSSCATSAGSRWCSCRTSPASWSAASTRPAASPSTAPRWSRPWPARGCPSSPWSSAAPSAPATTDVRAGLLARASCGCGPTPASR